MTPIPSGWKITSRDDETHRLDWGEDNPQLIEEKRKSLSQDTRFHEPPPLLCPVTRRSHLDVQSIAPH